MATLNPPVSNPKIIAHRGASGVYAENTRAAFLHAAAIGADLVETDVHLTADGVCVCMHEGAVTRPGDSGPVPVAQLTLAQLRELDFHTWHGSTIPAEYGTGTDQFLTLTELVELLRTVGRDIGLLIEMKEPYPFGRLLEQRVLEDLREFGWNPTSSRVPGATATGGEFTGTGVDIQFISFDPDSIQYLLQADVPPELIQAVVSLRRKDNARLISQGAVGVAALKWNWVRKSWWNAARARRWQRAGIKLNFWTLNKPSAVESAMLKFAPAYVTTDYPDIARAALEEIYSPV